eukprot:7391612-Karenia_brevis.AAC.1
MAFALSRGIPDNMWRVCFECARGYLPDGSVAKIPIGSITACAAWDIVKDQFTNLEVFAVRVAAMLKYFGLLSHDVASEFAAVFGVASARGSEIMKADAGFIVGFVSPVSEAWNFETSSNVELGLRITGYYIGHARVYTKKVVGREFDELCLHDQVFLLSCVKVVDVATPVHLTNEEAGQQNLLLKAVREINAICRDGDCNVSRIQQVAAELNTSDVLSECSAKKPKTDDGYKSE